MRDTIYCANCDTEATKRTEKGTPLCETCAEAYSWGVASPNGRLYDLDDPKVRQSGKS